MSEKFRTLKRTIFHVDHFLIKLHPKQLRSSWERRQRHQFPGVQTGRGWWRAACLVAPSSHPPAPHCPHPPNLELVQAL